MSSNKTAPCSDVRKCLRIREAARILDMKQQTVYLLCSQKKLPHVRFRGRLYFEKEVLIQWLQDQTERIGYEG